MNKFILIITAALCLASCSENPRKVNTPTPVKHKTAKVENPAKTREHDFVLYVQPYNGFDKDEAKKIAEDLQKNVVKYSHATISKIIVLDNVQLTKEQMNKAHSRYWAKGILNRQKHNKWSNCAELGLLNEDISTNVHGYDDYGIMGLAYMKQRNCVVSTHRIKGKKNTWKTVLHEFMHATMGMPHCRNNDPTCIMVDFSKGKGLSAQTHICDKCNESI